MSSVIDESFAINLKAYYAIDLFEHQLNDAFVISREIVSTPPAGRAIEPTLETSIDTTLSPELRTSEEVLYSRGDVESRVKRMVKRKLASRSK